MYITNLDEVITTIRGRLEDYLVLKGVKGPGINRFSCFAHDDKSPSMALNPKNNFETAHCFGCHTTHDIFSAANIIDNLPSIGAEWITETIPTLAELLEIPISIGEPSLNDKLKVKLYALARDIADLIRHPDNVASAYMEKRLWNNDYEDCYSVNYGKIMQALEVKGWDRAYVEASRLISISTEHNTYPLIGESMVTWVIKDHRGRPCAFISRNLDPDAQRKYIHSAESLIYQKREALLGLDLALSPKKHTSLIIVEGPGDRQQLLRLGIPNVAALCGTALTDFHLNHLKSLGVTHLVLCLDWDEAGTKATERIANLLYTKRINGFNIDVILPVEPYKDIDECLSTAGHDGKLPPRVPLFDWLISRTNITSPEDVGTRLIPVIAASPAAIKRDMMAQQLAEITGISHAAILTDVDRLRNNSYEERKERILAAADKYRSAVESDPTNVSAAFSNHENEISSIENEYQRDSFGANYQLSRFDAIQELKKDTSIDRSAFNLSTYTEFAKALSVGLPWTTGALIYWGGRENAAKTACMSAIALDVLVTDPDTMVIFYLTDDAYSVVEPRFITNTSMLLSGRSKLSIGEASAPAKGFKSAETSALYNQASTYLRGCLAEERLIILDTEDGSNLSVLERALKYARRKYPKRKVLVVLDNTYNLSDFPTLDQTARITRIADLQKRLVAKYQCCMFASAEYRKYDISNTAKPKYPTNDDLADARAIKYRASVIIHVYNDLNDRGEDAEVYWTDPFEPDVPKPQLQLIFGKNKLGPFKRSLIMNLDPHSVTVRQTTHEEATREWDERVKSGAVMKNGLLTVETDYDEEDEDNVE